MITIVDSKFIEFAIPHPLIEKEINFTIEDIIITGDFDNWTAKDYHLRLDDKGYYRVRIPVAESKKDTIFKFQINGYIWTTFEFFNITHDFEGHTNNIIQCGDCKNLDKNGKLTRTRLNDSIRFNEVTDYMAITNSANYNKNISNGLETSENSDAYINISSTSELSSIEDINLDFQEYDEENIDSTLVLDNNIPPSNINVFPNNYETLYFNTENKFNFDMITKRVRTLFK
ncbi:hypothetical protein TPHA_0C01380 [Tetrapisispora phaffii CBS 4417]|uniref:AMP-activated protein kinase glycogen-binding domain-containing protein n=1 Tax=Tetrapisispora phaffii (strain ATCC 24235 / CBS 4417 / NBRC 1672 / NRRL Y-8282 / UCD 70-5) TaxID=1071381 RepID=G8BRB8_TETPH|nr:hypothetical protein TPHA_0C01380 [Tetrapisispora phaffii CBS 4417]CCE62294.1 hypothetical protein TPHA_0C01380 [Tetrapisispora phaffii CBS 4417]